MNSDVVVADSSTAIKWYISEDYSLEAHNLLQEYQAGTIQLLAPDLIYTEVGSIIWKKQTFQGLLDAEAQAALNAFIRLPLLITPASSLLDDAYRIAVTHRRSVYDSLYLALSVRENCRFVTADEKLVNAVKSAFPNVVSLADWKTP